MRELTQHLARSLCESERAAMSIESAESTPATTMAGERTGPRPRANAATAQPKFSELSSEGLEHWPFERRGTERRVSIERPGFGPRAGHRKSHVAVSHSHTDISQGRLHDRRSAFDATGRRHRTQRHACCARGARRGRRGEPMPLPMPLSLRSTCGVDDDGRGELSGCACFFGMHLQGEGER